ncbi:MAG: hypothetical protein OXE43_07690 [Chloroflexi bacterium]|nr:hypothetical protein [Chloroflexota bacterium]
MPKTINIRNVPDEVHREAKVRAARARMSLSAYVLRELERSLESPPVEELLARLREQAPVRPSESPAEIIRAQRDAG